MKRVIRRMASERELVVSLSTVVEFLQPPLQSRWVLLGCLAMAVVSLGIRESEVAWLADKPGLRVWALGIRTIANGGKTAVASGNCRLCGGGLVSWSVANMA